MHPWIKKNQLKETKLSVWPGILSYRSRWYLHNPLSQICLREFLRGTKSTFPDGHVIYNAPEFSSYFGPSIETEITKLYTSKFNWAKENLFRLIHGDADGFPGIVADLYHDLLVIQFNHFVSDKFSSEFVNHIQAALKTVGLNVYCVIKKDHASRRLENLPVIKSEEQFTRVLEWNGLKWTFNPGGDQKTGSYLDQRDNHIKAKMIAQKLGLKKGVDLCSFEGGFGLHLASVGIEMICVDQSERALQRLMENARLNSLEKLIQVQQSDVFDFLKNLDQLQELIILDPPSFAKNKEQKKNAVEGLKRLNTLAISKISPKGGLLITCTCSGNISDQDLEGIVHLSAHNNKRNYSIIESGKASLDHTVLKGFEQSDYLHAKFVQIFPIS